MNRLEKIFFALALLAIPIAIYHGYEEITGFCRSCTITSTLSCCAVIGSGHTVLLGIPLYLYGLVWFPLLILVGLWSVRNGYGLRVDVFIPLLMVGNVFTIYLWSLEFNVIHAFCPVCISLYAINYLMTIVCAVEAAKSRAHEGVRPV